MYAASYLFRLAKAVSVAAIALLAGLITFNNVTDYYSNYYFVEHVPKIDTTFPTSQLHYRAINHPFLFYTGYIILLHAGSSYGFCCSKGSLSMFRHPMCGNFSWCPMMGHCRAHHRYTDLVCRLCSDQRRMVCYVAATNGTDWVPQKGY